MAKKRKQAKQHNRKKTVNWRQWIKNTIIGSVFLALIGTAVALHSKVREGERDVSVIGNGTPTVVQIHDPNCQLCLRLKSNLDSVKGEFKDNIQFKTVNIAASKGRNFAAKYRVPHVTLLFFDKRGERVNTLQGVTPKEEIRTALNALEKRR